MELVRKVKVQNMTRGTVTYLVDNKGVRRTFKPKTPMNVPFEELEEALFDPGVAVMFSTGMLAVMDEKDSVDLGLKGEDGIVETIVADEKTILNLLKGENGAFFTFMQNASVAARNSAVQLAIENEITDKAKAKIIKDIANADIVKTILRKREEEEEEKAIPETRN